MKRNRQFLGTGLGIMAVSAALMTWPADGVMAGPGSPAALSVMSVGSAIRPAVNPLNDPKGYTASAQAAIDELAAQALEVPVLGPLNLSAVQRRRIDGLRPQLLEPWRKIYTIEIWTSGFEGEVRRGMVDDGLPEGAVQPEMDRWNERTVDANTRLYVAAYDDLLRLMPRLRLYLTGAQLAYYDAVVKDLAAAKAAVKPGYPQDPPVTPVAPPGATEPVRRAR